MSFQIPVPIARSAAQASSDAQSSSSSSSTSTSFPVPPAPHTTSSISGKKYTPPSWSADPQHEYSLEVMKEGRIIDNIDIGVGRKKGRQPFFVLGRQADVVDIAADHPSISRQHAALQFRGDGILFLQDLQSAQGTFVNKQQIAPSPEFHQLFVGDMFKLGASTRMYIVSGPELFERQEYESQRLKDMRVKLAEASAKSNTSNSSRNGDGNLITTSTSSNVWGMSDDVDDTRRQDQEDGGDSDDSDDVPDYIKKDRKLGGKSSDKTSFSSFGLLNSNENHSNLSEAERKIVEKLDQLRRKLENMDEERRRILVKEGGQDGGLTTGQKAVLVRNEQKVGELKQEINELVHQSMKLQNDKDMQNNSGLSSNKKRDEMDEDSDVFLDISGKGLDLDKDWRRRKKQAALAGSTGGGASNGGSGIVNIQSLLGASSSLRSSGISGEKVAGYEDFCCRKDDIQQRLAEISRRREEIDSENSSSIASSSLSGEDDAIGAVLRETMAADLGRERESLSREDARLRTDLVAVKGLIELTKPLLSSSSSSSSSVSSSSSSLSSTSTTTTTTTKSSSLPVKGSTKIAPLISTASNATITTGEPSNFPKYEVLSQKSNTQPLSSPSIGPGNMKSMDMEIPSNSSAQGDEFNYHSDSNYIRKNSSNNSSHIDNINSRKIEASNSKINSSTSGSPPIQVSSNLPLPSPLAPPALNMAPTDKALSATSALSSSVSLGEKKKLVMRDSSSEISQQEKQREAEKCGVKRSRGDESNPDNSSSRSSSHSTTPSVHGIQTHAPVGDVAGAGSGRHVYGGGASAVSGPITLMSGPSRPLIASASKSGSQLGAIENEEKEEKDVLERFVKPKGQAGDGRTHLNEKLGY